MAFFNGQIHKIDSEIMDDIEVLVQNVLMSPGDGTSQNAALISCAERVEAYLATYREKDV